MRRLLLFAPIAAALAGCGTPSADLFVVTRSGSLPQAHLVLRVSDGGFVTCNGGKQHEITSKQLIRARGILHELQGDDKYGRDQGLDGPIDVKLHLPPQPASTLRYDLRGEDGTVGFSDNSLKQPKVFGEIQLFTRQMAVGVCHLPR